MAQAQRTESERMVALETAYEHVATKADVESVRTEIERVRAEVERVRAEVERVRAEIEKLKSDLTWRIVIAMSIMTGIFVAVVRLPI